MPTLSENILEAADYTAAIARQHHRLATQRRVADAFVGVGVKLKRENPVYFDPETGDVDVRLENGITAGQAAKLLTLGLADDFTISALGLDIAVEFVLKSGSQG